jgi:hypothetical protein
MMMMQGGLGFDAETIFFISLSTEALVTGILAGLMPINKSW